jgi:MFS family permease
MANDPYAVLRLRDFRLLLATRLLLTVASQIQGITVGWQIYALTKSPLDLGLVGLSEAIPAIGVALYAGHIADVFDRRRVALVVISGFLGSFILLALISTRVTNVHLLVPLIFFMVAFGGFCRGFYPPAVFGMVSDIVPRELYANASAWNSSVWQSSAVAGPLLGGLLYVSFGAPITYVVSSILCLGALACLFQSNSKTQINKQKQVSVLQNIKEGLHFVFSRQIILGAMALDLFAVLFGGAVALLPIFTSEIYHMGPQALGMLRGAPSVGAFLTSTFLTHHPLSKSAGKILLFSVAGFGLCMIAFGLCKNFYLALFLLALSGMLDGVSVYVRSNINQLLTPNEMKGRIAAVSSMFIGSSNEIGEFESGVTAKLMGLIPSVVFGGCMTLLVVAYTWWKAPKLRNLDLHRLVEQEAT